MKSYQQARVLLVPGIGNSGPEHWQTLWERRHEDYVRVQQRDWDHPVCAEWIATLDRAGRETTQDVVIAAHSLGALLVAHWLPTATARIRGALLVAVPDPEGPRFPPEAKGFAPVPQVRLTCPSIVVASTDDPYGGLPIAAKCAHAWGSQLVNVGNLGHINAASGLGNWDDGHRLLMSFQARAAGTREIDPSSFA